MTSSRPLFFIQNMYKYLKKTTKFAGLTSGNTTTMMKQPVNAAKARPSQFVAKKADFGASFKGWVLRRTLQNTKEACRP